MSHEARRRSTAHHHKAPSRSQTFRESKPTKATSEEKAQPSKLTQVKTIPTRVAQVRFISWCQRSPYELGLTWESCPIQLHRIQVVDKHLLVHLHIPPTKRTHRVRHVHPGDCTCSHAIDSSLYMFTADLHFQVSMSLLHQTVACCYGQSNMCTATASVHIS